MTTLRLAVLLAFLFGAITSAQTSPAPKTLKAVKFGKLWDAKGKVWTNAIVIIEDDRIKSVTTSANEIPAGAHVLYLSNYTGLPGFIDVHTHLTMYTEETPGKPMLKQLVDNPPAHVNPLSIQ